MNKHVLAGDEQSPAEVARWIDAHGCPGAVMVLRISDQGITNYVPTQLWAVRCDGLSIEYPESWTFTRDGSMVADHTGASTRLLIPTSELLDVINNGVRHIDGLSYPKSRMLQPRDEMLLKQAREQVVRLKDSGPRPKA